LVEPFDPAANPEFKPEKDFKARLVLLNRDTLLLEMPPLEFAEAQGLRLLAADNVAVNLSVPFRVETFTPTEAFKAKPALPDPPQMARSRRQRAEQASRHRAAGRSRGDLAP
jgi:hypothetical protein